MKYKDTKIYKSLSEFLSVLSDKRLDMYSAGAAFYIFMSFIPYLLIVFSTIKYLPFSKQDLLGFIDDILPVSPDSFMVSMVDELYTRGLGVLSVSIIAAIWASAKGVLGITKGLNEIFDAKAPWNFVYLRIRSAVCTLLLMVAMILVLVISVFGKTIVAIVNRYIMIPKHVSDLIENSNLIMWPVLFLLFMFFFCVLPARKIKPKSQITGAAGASLIWILFTNLFSFYLSTFNGYSMYGGFAVIIVIGVWLYACMYIMFMGALVNELLASRKGLNHERSHQ